ncbi:MAG: siphovirus Gp157 family protein [Enhydrobacter sp.]|nr:siphovirus Gp157 family protein [Enhydrobacter sp.]
MTETVASPAAALPVPPVSGMSPAVAAELHQHLYLKERLEAEFPDLDDETLADTLDGETRLNEALAAVLRSREEDLALVAGLKARIETMRVRLERFQDRAERKRGLVADVMVRADIRRLLMPDFTASLRTVPPGLVVEDEAQVPAVFWKPQAPKLDRAALGEALRRGETVAGATLGAARCSITIRTA